MRPRRLCRKKPWEQERNSAKASRLRWPRTIWRLEKSRSGTVTEGRVQGPEIRGPSTASSCRIASYVVRSLDCILSVMKIYWRVLGRSVSIFLLIFKTIILTFRITDFRGCITLQNGHYIHNHVGKSFWPQEGLGKSSSYFFSLGLSNLAM